MGTFTPHPRGPASSRNGDDLHPFRWYPSNPASLRDKKSQPLRQPRISEPLPLICAMPKSKLKLTTTYHCDEAGGPSFSFSTRAAFDKHLVSCPRPTSAHCTAMTVERQKTRAPRPRKAVSRHERSMMHGVRPLVVWC